LEQVETAFLTMADDIKARVDKMSLGSPGRQSGGKKTTISVGNTVAVKEKGCC
jgi:hypothetical protein